MCNYQNNNYQKSDNHKSDNLKSNMNVDPCKIRQYNINKLKKNVTLPPLPFFFVILQPKLSIPACS